MEIRTTSDNFTGGITRKEVERTPRVASAADAPTRVNRLMTTVYSTEEVTALFDYVKQQGGQIVATQSLRAGAGISVTMEIPAASENRKE
ncbi:hypothetical protein [Rossellomorea sp. LjRoot5]|uniref:hypothetical protein n=1 Tax=Rossellomorea sp. LjRoot5 TaxID=3342331 RepID=UPI003ECDEFD7